MIFKPPLSTQPIQNIPLTPTAFVQGIRRALGTTSHGPVVTVDRLGRPSQAYLFDGVDDFLDIPTDPIASSQQFTIVVTFKLSHLPSGLPNSYPITVVAKYGTYIIQVTRLTNNLGGIDTKGTLVLHYGNMRSSCERNLIDAGQYYQVALVCGNGRLRFVVNGVQKLVLDNIQTFSLNTSSILVGRGYYNDHPEFFHGVIDEVRVFDVPVSDEELLRLFQTGGI